MAYQIVLHLFAGIGVLATGAFAYGAWELGRQATRG